jgi:hypothetical protein
MRKNISFVYDIVSNIYYNNNMRFDPFFAVCDFHFHIYFISSFFFFLYFIQKVFIQFFFVAIPSWFADKKKGAKKMKNRFNPCHKKVSRVWMKKDLKNKNLKDCHVLNKQINLSHGVRSLITKHTI